MMIPPLKGELYIDGQKIAGVTSFNVSNVERIIPLSQMPSNFSKIITGAIELTNTKWVKAMRKALISIKLFRLRYVQSKYPNNKRKQHGKPMIRKNSYKDLFRISR